MICWVLRWLSCLRRDRSAPAHYRPYGPLSVSNPNFLNVKDYEIYLSADDYVLLPRGSVAEAVESGEEKK